MIVSVKPYATELSQAMKLNEKVIILSDAKVTVLNGQHVSELKLYVCNIVQKLQYYFN